MILMSTLYCSGARRADGRPTLWTVIARIDLQAV